MVYKITQMKKIFLIPGFLHTLDAQQYKWMEPYFCSIGYDVMRYDVPWEGQVQSDDIIGFKKFYYENKSDHFNVILGFSFGAMIAMISSVELVPDELHICSLSYFKEDLHVVTCEDIDKVGVDRIENMKKFSGKEIAQSISTSKVVLYGGELELADWPQYKVRFDETAKIIACAKKIIIKDAHHDIGNENYISAIKKNITR